MTNNANSSARKIKIRRASFLLFSLSRHLNFLIEITYLDVYFSQKNHFQTEIFHLMKAMKNLHASNELVSAKANSLLRMH